MRTCGGGEEVRKIGVEEDGRGGDENKNKRGGLY